MSSAANQAGDEDCKRAPGSTYMYSPWVFPATRAATAVTTITETETITTSAVTKTRTPTVTITVTKQH